MNFKKSVLVSALALSFALPMQAHAGKIKKIIAVGALATAGVVAYKIGKKMKVGSEIENLVMYPENVIPYLNDNPERIPYVVSDLTVIFNSPEYAPGGPNKPTDYLNLADKIEKDLGVPVDRGPWTGVNGDMSIGEPTVAKKDLKVNVTVVEDEALLEKNMQEAGYGSKPYGFKAFHLINAKNQALPVLMGLNIDINSAINGVYLPTEIYDSFKNNEVYQKDSADKVKKVYETTPNKTAIKNVLRELNKELTP